MPFGGFGGRGGGASSKGGAVSKSGASNKGGAGGKGLAGGAKSSKNREIKPQTPDKNALRKKEEEANKEPSAHAAKIHAKKAARKEKAKARAADEGVISKRAEGKYDNKDKKTYHGDKQPLPETAGDMGWGDAEGNIVIRKRL